MMKYKNAVKHMMMQIKVGSIFLLVFVILTLISTAFIWKFFVGFTLVFLFILFASMRNIKTAIRKNPMLLEEEMKD